MAEFTPWFGEIRPVTGVILASGRSYPVNGERYFSVIFWQQKKYMTKRTLAFVNLYNSG
jgi:hypothetical protein